ncbi:hypothetical protein BZK31_04620 [Pseudomonas floridensis]|uniref:Uncharacterized protein n=1 Tax=Pseudomonas floridensis TaxID=1958950 RepID=A0A1X0NAC0_9PSED|nr:hypothetical protein [Pseudomonas floridensis]ORC61039.1 hypothetical protein BZK31_04620 [Pseudomonas floridensis]
MMSRKLSALGLAMILAGASVSALAGSTGPTNPNNDSPKVPGTGMEKNVDGTSPGAKGTSPGTKGMDPEPSAGMRGQTPDSQQQDMDDNDDQDDDNAP